MKVAVAGKGGSGKTTVSGTLSRLLGRLGHPVIALDADTNPMLGISVGVGPEETYALTAVRQGLDSGETEHQPSVRAMFDTFGRSAPDGVQLVVASRIEKNDPGCPCCGVSPEQMLREFEDDNIVVADLEAGVGTLTRLPENGVDALVVITEPTTKSIEVARIILGLADERHGRARVIKVGNRVTNEAEIAHIESAIGAMDVVVPEDPSVTEADRAGTAPIDRDEHSPAVMAISELIEILGTSTVPVPA